MFTFATLQAQVSVWSFENFGLHDGTQPLLGVVEEVGELSHVHLKTLQNIRNAETTKEARVDAVGDILVYLADYCFRENINMQLAVQETWKKVQRRNWKKNPNDAHLKA